ncbi:hypothetical protein D3C87_2106240 [compost metagenome]
MNAPVGTVVEAHHSEFDDFVVTRIQTRRFNVHKQARPQPLHIRLDQGQSVLKLAQNTILAARLERSRHRF